MDILSRIIDSKTTIDYLSVLNSRIEELLSPIVFNPSAMSYSEYISSLGYYIHSRARDIIKETLEEMDTYFFKLKGRTLRYYSKGYRKREIITVFGHIIYYRHEYVDRNTGKPFIYVDEKIGLHRKDRYDPTVCSLIFERYSDNNSMIKIGKDIGTALNLLSSVKLATQFGRTGYLFRTNWLSNIVPYTGANIRACNRTMFLFYLGFLIFLPFISMR